mmetsp:Transcript_12214/g.32321  ORF Transcript_12214/g.32321 Transcript_12214/m.32321 type:complete len:232 (+) Transcript_12214:376-1071(+)
MRVLQFPKRRQHPRTKSPNLFIRRARTLLSAQPKLNGEPVDATKPLDILVRRAQRAQPDFLRHLSELRVAQHRRVPKHLVADVRLRGVERATGMSNVLRGVEHTECKPVEEIARGEEAHDGLEGEAGGGAEVRGDVTKLGDCTRGEDAVLFQEAHRGVVFPAGVGRAQCGEFFVDDAPGLLLGGGVVDGREALAVLVAHGVFGDFGAAEAVLFVVESRMVGIQLAPELQAV